MFKDKGLTLSGGLIECGSQSLIRQLLQDSNRLTFISRHQIKQEEDQGVLVALKFNPEQSSRPIGLT